MLNVILSLNTQIYHGSEAQLAGTVEVKQSKKKKKNYTDKTKQKLQPLITTLPMSVHASKNQMFTEK